MEFWCNCTERGKAEVLEEQPDPPPLFLSANATWALLEMNAGLRFEKLAASSLSYDKTVLKFPMWFLDWLGLHWLGFSVISNFIFRSEPYLLEYTASRKRTANLTTAILKQREEGTHGRRKEKKVRCISSFSSA